MLIGHFNPMVIGDYRPMVTFKDKDIQVSGLADGETYEIKPTLNAKNATGFTVTFYKDSNKTTTGPEGRDRLPLRIRRSTVRSGWRTIRRQHIQIK